MFIITHYQSWCFLFIYSNVVSWKTESEIWISNGVNLTLPTPTTGYCKLIAVKNIFIHLLGFSILLFDIKVYARQPTSYWGRNLFRNAVCCDNLKKYVMSQNKQHFKTFCLDFGKMMKKIMNFRAKKRTSKHVLFFFLRNVLLSSQRIQKCNWKKRPIFSSGTPHIRGQKNEKCRSMSHFFAILITNPFWCVITMSLQHHFQLRVGIVF